MFKKSILTSLFIFIALIFLSTMPIQATNSSKINIILNGNIVEFTNDTGYPYVDEKSRTMVPLRATMEAAGFAVGYDSLERTAIVITEHGRIEVPINTNIIYANNTLIENDTSAVVKNGRTYLPIRAVLENAGYTVEWDGKTQTVNAYTFKFDKNDFVPYSTSSLKTLISDILNGNVVYANGKYYATPAYVKMMTNVKIHYLNDDLNTAIYPETSRFDAAEISEDDYEWVSGVLPNNILFDKITVEDEKLKKWGVTGVASDITGYSSIYAFYEQGGTDTIIVYPFDEITEEFIKSSDAVGTFNGIRMKKEGGHLYFNYSDLKTKKVWE